MNPVERDDRSSAGEDKACMIYVYCLALSDRFSDIKGPAVDGDGHFICHRRGRVVAVTSEVLLEEFSGPAAEDRMQDLEWVGPRVCAHMKVIEQVMQSSAVLPFPFGTIFYSFSSLDDRLSKNMQTIEHFLSYVEDKQEWAIKGLVSTQDACEAIYADLLAKEQQHAPDSPGKRYFFEKKIRAGAQARLGELTQTLAQSIVADVSEFVTDERVRKILPGAVAGTSEEMFLNLAVLVPTGKVPEIISRLDEVNAALADRFLRFQYSGPWPPYSFTPDLE
jgi:hypothetical protein